MTLKCTDDSFACLLLPLEWESPTSNRKSLLGIYNFVQWIHQHQPSFARESLCAPRTVWTLVLCRQKGDKMFKLPYLSTDLHIRFSSHPTASSKSIQWRLSQKFVLFNIIPLNLIDLIDLSDLNINLIHHANYNYTSDHLGIMYSNGFIPVIDRSTRVTNHSATLIDHIFTNCYEKMFYVPRHPCHWCNRPLSYFPYCSFWKSPIC